MDLETVKSAVVAAARDAGVDEASAAALASAVAVATSASTSGVPAGQMMIDALTRMPADAFARPGQYNHRSSVGFETRSGRPDAELTYIDGTAGRFVLRPAVVLEAVLQANSSLLALHQFTSMLRVPISELLGMRNLSSLVSSVMVSELQAVLSEDVYINPHQDGYPDLIPRTDASVEYYEHMKAAGRLTDKTAWTDAGFGGIEVKATCGNTPAAKTIAKRGLGEMRADIITGFDWKAHHRETKRLLATIWDFVDGVPTVTAAFFRNDLVEDDWGKIVSPKDGGGRTTSVSIMARGGIAKMADGWMVRTTDTVLRQSLEKARMIRAAATAAESAAMLLDDLLTGLEAAARAPRAPGR